MNQITRLYAPIVVTALLAGCTPYVQETSGHDYVERYRQDSMASGDAVALKAIDRATGGDSAAEPMELKSPRIRTIDEMVVAAASVEPLLRFPARIGLARLDGFYRSDIPAEEADAWMGVARDLQDGVGELLPINHMLGDDAAVSVGLKSGHYTSQQTSIAKIRLAAARQHIDAVVIYRTRATSGSDATLAAALDYTLIGTFLVPGHVVEARAIANAIIIDVRNGYMYGAVTEVADRTRLTNYWSTSDVERSSENLASTRAARKLAPAVGAFLKDMRDRQLRARAGLPS